MSGSATLTRICPDYECLYLPSPLPFDFALLRFLRLRAATLPSTSRCYASFDFALLRFLRLRAATLRTGLQRRGTGRFIFILIVHAGVPPAPRGMKMEAMDGLKGWRAGTGACPYKDGLFSGRRGRPKPALSEVEGCRPECRAARHQRELVAYQCAPSPSPLPISRLMREIRRGVYKRMFVSMTDQKRNRAENTEEPHAA